MICNLKNILLVVMLSSFMMSCKKELKNDILFINNLSNETEYDLPFVNESLIIFVKDGDRIFVTSIRKLFEEYSESYKKKYSFDDFLVNVINNKELSVSQIDRVSNYNFKMNQNIADLYKNHDLNYFITKFCYKSNSLNKFYIKEDLSFDEKNNVMFYFFKNNYYVMFNDYDGRFVLINKN